MQTAASGNSRHHARLTPLWLTAAIPVCVLGLGLAAQAQETAQTPSQTTPTAQAAPDDSTVVVVKGVRASITKSLATKRRSTQVVDSIVAEDIGKLPDNNVIEALQRVAGVQVTDRGGGEVGTISIRGMPDISTTWNGRNVFTASSRQLSLQDIPSTLVRQIDVYKTRSASQLESGIAGQIDVSTLRPFDFKGFEVSLAGRGSYDEQSGNFNPNVSGLISNRWSTGAGDFGALLNLSYSRAKYRVQTVTAGALVPFATVDDPPAGWSALERLFNGDARAGGATFWQPGTNTGLSSEEGATLNINGVDVPYYLSRDAVFATDLTGDRERPAANIALQWQPNADAVYTFEFMYDGYRNTTFSNLLFSYVDGWWDLGDDPSSSFTLYPGTNIIKSRTTGSVYGFNSGDLTTAKTDSFIYALNGKWNIGDRFSLVGDLSYQNSVYTSEFMAMRTERTAGSITADFNAHDGIAAFSFDDNSLLADPSQWTVAQFYDNANRNKGYAGTASLDGVYEADWGPVKKISFGVRYDDRKAEEAARGQSAYLGQALSSLDSGLQYYNTDFYDGRSDVPTSWVVANGYYIRDHIDEIRELYHSVDSSFKTTDELSLFTNFRADEKTTSLYAQADLENQLLGRRLRSQFGLRYVDIETDLNFYQLVDSSVVETTAQKQISKVLPSATLRYDVSDDILVRLNYGETLRRPNFGDLNPYTTLTDAVTNSGYGSGSKGNPDLTATHAKNLDLTAEWYFSKDSALYGTLFQRKIDGLVVTMALQEDTTNTATGNTGSYLVSTPYNASNGVLEGMELGLTYFPKDLPGVLNGLGVQASVTKLDSSQNVPNVNSEGEIIGQLKTDFFGVSKLSYNITLAYEHGPLGARLSYVWRDRFLASNEASSFANPIGVWRRPEKDLDLQLNYNISPRLSVSVDAVNLTDELQQNYYYFNGGYGGQDTDNLGSTILGRTFSIGFRWKM
ncbi:MAG: TonB-dependent receptor [Asticcacaulis sp.]|uniref:TonB-dependent receptor n=1 Tax=Asticcacaulis sp. TaxID=1872648 RepID=UPI0039E22309